MEILNIRPSDILVVKISPIPSEESKEKIKNKLFENIGFETRVLFLDAIELDVIRPEIPSITENLDEINEEKSIHKLLYWNDEKIACMYHEDIYFNPGTPVLVDVDGYPIYYDGLRDFLSIKEAKLISGKLYVTNSEPERKLLGGKVKRSEVPLAETKASIEVIEGEL